MILELFFDKLLTVLEISIINKYMLDSWNKLIISDDDTELYYKIEENLVSKIEEIINIKIKNTAEFKYVTHKWSQ